MNAYNPTSLTKKLTIAALTVVLGLGTLQLVAGGMTHPDPEAVAARQQFIAMEAEVAQENRDLARGVIRYADNTAAGAR